MGSMITTDQSHIATLNIEPNPSLPDGPTSVYFGSIPSDFGYLILVAVIPDEHVGISVDSELLHTEAGACGDTMLVTNVALPWRSSLTVRPAGAETFPIGSMFRLYGQR
jgi:hypothetical protein